MGQFILRIQFNSCNAALILLLHLFLLRASLCTIPFLINPILPLSHTPPLSSLLPPPLPSPPLPYPPEATYCYPLPSTLDLTIRRLKMHLGVDSIPIVAEVGWLVFNAALYLILFPMAVSQDTHACATSATNAYCI